MGAETLAAIALAGNIVQFLDFSVKLLKQSHEIYTSARGASDDLVNAEISIEDLVQATQRLQTSLHPPETSKVLTAADASLDRLRERCFDTGQDFLDLLDKLTIKGHRTRWKSIKLALAKEWKDGTFKELERRLAGLRDEMHLHVTVALKEQIDLVAIRQADTFQQLDESSQKIVELLLENHKDVISDVKVQTKVIEETHGKTVDPITFESTSIKHDIASSGERATHEHQEIIAEVENANAAEHAETRAVISSQAATLEDRMVTQHKETRAAIARAGDDGLVVLQRMADHVLALQAELRQQHAFERERTRDELFPWIAALMVQNMRVLEAHQAATEAAAQATAGRGRSKAKEALERAKQALQRAIELLIEIAGIFEKEIGLRYGAISDVIAESVRRVKPATFIRDLLTWDRTTSYLSKVPDVDSLDVFVTVNADYSAGVMRREAHGCIFVPFGEMAVPLKIAREEYQPLWGLYCTEVRLKSLTLEDWTSFADQRWIYVHDGCKDNTTLLDEIIKLATGRQSSSYNVPKEKLYFQLAEFQWSEICSRDLIPESVRGFSCSLLDSAPESPACSMKSVPYWPSRPIESRYPLQTSRIDSIHGSPLPTSIIDLIPTYTVMHGQPLRPSAVQTVWGVSIAFGCAPKGEVNIARPFQIIWCSPSTESRDIAKGSEERRRLEEWRRLEEPRKFIWEAESVIEASRMRRLWCRWADGEERERRVQSLGLELPPIDLIVGAPSGSPMNQLP